MASTDFAIVTMVKYWKQFSSMEVAELFDIPLERVEFLEGLVDKDLLAAYHKYNLDYSGPVMENLVNGKNDDKEREKVNYRSKIKLLACLNMSTQEFDEAEELYTKINSGILLK